MTLVSVIIPTYNRAALLDRCLASVAGQTRRDFDVWVVDDCSPDLEGYRQVIERYAPTLELHYVRSMTRRGAQYSRNRGVALSRGEHLAFVDDDDEWLPEKIEKQLSLLQKASSQVGLVYSWADTIDSAGHVLFKFRESPRGRQLSLLLDRCFIPSPSVMVRREALECAGGFDEAFPACQDWDTWTCVLKAGFACDLVPAVLALNHHHPGPSIGRSSDSLHGYRLYYRKHLPAYLDCHLEVNLSEKYRSLGWSFAGRGEWSSARECLLQSLSLNRFNWKSWVRLAQVFLRQHPDRTGAAEVAP